MSFDINGGYRGSLYGRDRLGYTTPDADASEPLRPFLTVPYPAPWLPGKRLDEGHPVGAQVVLSSHQVVGMDKSGALIPAGLKCGSQTAVGGTITNSVGSGTVATFTMSAPDIAKFKVGDNFVVAGLATNTTLDGQFVVASIASSTTLTAASAVTASTHSEASGTARLVNGYVVLQYSANDVGFARNAATGNPVASAAEYVVLAAPSDGAAGDTVTLPNGNVITITTGDLSFALACNLIPGGVAKPIGYIIRNAWQFLGGVTLITTTGGIQYNLESMIPSNFRVHNYMHEMGVAICTHFVLRLPWIGATPTSLTTLAAGVSGYLQTDFGRSFVHMTGGTTGHPEAMIGSSVVASQQGFGSDAGNYSPYNAAVNGFDDICGRVIGVEALYPIRDFANRVRTQFERASEAVGPFTTKTPGIGQLGGSATRGMDYAIAMGTDGVFRLASDQGASIQPEYMSYVYTHLNFR